MSKKISGEVVKNIDDYRLVINRGSDDGISENSKFFVYYNAEELFDPRTHESLGILEVSCGTGSVEHVQEKMTTIISSKFKTEEISDGMTFSLLGGASKTVSIRLPFKHLTGNALLFKTI